MEKDIYFNYYVELPDGMFGIPHSTKKKAIKTFLDSIAMEKTMEDSEYWQEHAKKYEEMIKNGQVKIVTIRVERVTTKNSCDIREELNEKGVI